MGIEPRQSAARALLQAGLWAATARILPGLWQPDDLRQGTELETALLNLAIREKMAPMLSELLRSQGLRLPGLSDEMEQLSAVAEIASRALFENVGPLLDRCKQEGIEIVLLKGGDLACSLYPEKPARFMLDLDLLVHPEVLDAVRAIFRTEGYQQGRINKQALQLEPMTEEETAELESEHYELVPFRKLVRSPLLTPFASWIARYINSERLFTAGEDVYQVLEYDVHFNLSHGIDLGDVWSGLRKTRLPDGREVAAQGFSDILWFLCAKLYHEIMVLNLPAMRMFADVSGVAVRFADQIDWERIRSRADKYNLHPSLFYCFWHINELFGPIVPEDLIAAFSPANEGIHRLHDWGDFSPKLLQSVSVIPMLDLKHEAPPLSARRSVELAR